MSPANYHRLYSQRAMTQAICEKVRISKTDFRGPTNAVNEITVLPAGSLAYETENGACSIALVNARIAATKQAYEEETTSLTDRLEQRRAELAGPAPEPEEEKPETQEDKLVAEEASVVADTENAQNDEGEEEGGAAVEEAELLAKENGVAQRP